MEIGQVTEGAMAQVHHFLTIDQQNVHCNAVTSLVA
jgi:hypothetical protein